MELYDLATPNPLASSQGEAELTDLFMDRPLDSTSIAVHRVNYTRDLIRAETMPSRRQFVTGGSAAMVMCIDTGQTDEISALDFYRGKTVRILVGSPPGDGYDLYARLLAPHLARKLNATVLVENRDGNRGARCAGGAGPPA